MLVSDPQIAGVSVCGRLRVRCCEHLDLATVITVSQALSGKKLLDTLLFDTNFVGIFLWDFDGRVLQANDAFLRIVGYEREDLVAGRMRWTDITPPDLRDRQAERIREHKSTGRLQPFEKEYFRKDGTRVPVLVGVATLEEGGNQGVGFVLDLTERKRAEEERRAHVWFLESMDRVNRAMQGTNDVEQMMGDVLEAVLEIFASDRAWLLYPCDPDAPSWRPVMERTRPEFPGAAARGRDLPMTPESAEVARVALASSGALLRGGSHEHQPSAEIAEHFGVRSDMLMALRPKGDRPYLFGLHQCSRVRTWTKEEQRLFEEVGHRLTDALGSLIAFRGLRESEARLEAAQRLARVGWWERDYATGHVSLSDEACRIFGVQPLELPQWHGRWLSLIHPEDRENVAAASDLALRGGPRYDVEYRVVRPDGAVRVVHSQGDVTREESGRPVRQFGVMQDITELRQAEEALRESEQRYRTLFEKANDAIFLENERDEIIEVNERACTLLGYSREELLKMKVPDLQAPEVRGQVGRVIRERIEKHGSATFETVDLHRSGRRIPVEVTIAGISHRGENLVLSVVRDITERKRIEAELRARQEMLDLAQKAARAVAFDWYIGARESENRWSPDLEVMYGLEPGTFDRTYQGWKKLVHPDDWPAVKLALKRAHESGDVEAEYRVIHKDGSVHWLQAKGRMSFDAEGRPDRMVGFMIDVTDRRHAEEELRASEARFRTFVDHATDGLFLQDEHAVVIDVNRQACESMGYSRDELIGMHPRDFDAGLDAASVAQLGKRVGAGETVTFETLHRRKDGSVFPVEVRVRQFQQGKRRLNLSIVRDTSERKLAEETLREKDNALQMARTELARVSRLTTLGELTTSVVHEVSQPLGAMIASAAAGARWLAADPPEIAEARSALDNIAADGKRAREVIARIRALAKRQAPRLELLDINRKILEVLALTEHELRSHDIVLQAQLGEALRRVAGDRIQLQQVLLNLILNAIEAMSGVHDRPRQLTIVSREDAPNAVVVEVRDSGTGLDPEGAERVFEAFYTTKAEGIGIGLSISRSIIEAHGGRLWASSNEPRGAVFGFSLPVAGEEQS